MDSSPRLRRTLGLWQVTLSGVGVILGAGVYALIGPAAGHTGNALWLAFLLASLAAGFTGYSYARLAPLRPRNSAEFQYTSLAFGPRVGFVAGWLMLAADLLAAAAVALGFGGYLSHLTSLPLVVSAFVLMAIVGCVLYAGITESIGLVIALTVVEAAGLVFIIAVGIPYLGSVNYLETASGIDGLGTATGLVIFAYLGFDEIGNLAEETRDPERNLPRALLGSLAAASVIYILVSLAAVSVIGWEDLRDSPAPLAAVAGRVLGDQAGTLVSFIALAATGNTVLLLLISASRSLYGLGVSRALPAFLGGVASRGIPLAATSLSIGIVCLLLLLGDIGRVASLTNAAILGVYMMIDLSLLRLSTTTAGRDLLRNHLAADRIVPILGLASCLWVLWFTGVISVVVSLVLAAIGVALGGWTVRETDGAGIAEVKR